LGVPHPKPTGLEKDSEDRGSKLRSQQDPRHQNQKSGAKFTSVPDHHHQCPGPSTMPALSTHLPRANRTYSDAMHQVLIAGDFNAPTVDLVNLQVDDARTSFDSKLMDLTLDQPMVQKVNIPTTLRENQRANYLEQVFLKDFSGVDEVYSILPLEPELQLDHDNSSVKDAGLVLEYILFPEPLVDRELQNLKEAKSSGPDDLPAKFLKELAGELSKPLAHIFNSSFESGKQPSEWKAANI
uniref:Reverse transcriptase domain-containing protein n=1 Tax=Schistocephalus solidus TaxID=70667 RepID=A0A183TJP9_SCHSO